MSESQSEQEPVRDVEPSVPDTEEIGADAEDRGEQRPEASQR